MVKQGVVKLSLPPNMKSKHKITRKKVLERHLHKLTTTIDIKQ